MLEFELSETLFAPKFVRVLNYSRVFELFLSVNNLSITLSSELIAPLLDKDNLTAQKTIAL